MPNNEKNIDLIDREKNPPRVLYRNLYPLHRAGRCPLSEALAHGSLDKPLVSHGR
jgi:hypothetical protein